MKKSIFILISLFLLYPAYLFAAAGQGVSSWTAQTEAISGSDLVGITDVSDTTQSDDGSSKKATFSQVGTYMATLFTTFPGFTDILTDYGIDLNDYALADNRIFLLGALSDLPILDSRDGVDGNPLVDDTVNYGDADDHLHIWSIQQLYTYLMTADINTSGIITAAIQTATDADAHTLTAAEYNGGEVLATGAGIYTLPTAVAGRNGCVRSGQGVAAVIQLLPASGDYIVLNGARGTVATAIASAGAAGDKICYLAHNDTDWYVDVVGTWAE